MLYLEKILNTIIPWLLNHGIKIALILAAVIILKRFLNVIVKKFVERIIVADHFLTQDAKEKRENTLAHIFISSLGIIIWILAGLMILQEIGVEIAPLLAAVGIVGIAFGFGGQYLIRDLISGVFIIMENQYRIGDVVCFDGTCGSVEDISMRMTVLRDLDGTVHHVPHGEIKKVSNLSKTFARVNLDIGVSYNSNLEKVISVINQIGDELAKDEKWKDFILEPPQFVRVNDFADSSVMIKILGKTKPLQQWAVTGELRKRIKVAFDKEGIEIPFPQTVIHKAKDN